MPSQRNFLLKELTLASWVRALVECHGGWSGPRRGSSTSPRQAQAPQAGRRGVYRSIVTAPDLELGRRASVGRG